MDKKAKFVSFECARDFIEKKWKNKSCFYCNEAKWGPYESNSVLSVRRMTPENIIPQVADSYLDVVVVQCMGCGQLVFLNSDFVLNGESSI